ncbi:two-component system regulatory protein YycI [Alkalibacillus haloalkaliphilus]|uniref:two-component system regulatory protein YycI n=1 Tax=Alkalibacillus haloalkaliphilus TaxID=94136 RepID=UPI0029358AD9|nr:two-component system regulatory protein YycI [Alkalibacillus haloalkaliphilus]MDV2581563.1 two-component system regulatory protein YycI [Alkalibacillus haloalkaliphilus]
MQWGQIKTLFIISFLILNLFLAQQFLEKIGDTNLEMLAQTSFEDQLVADEIEVGDLPERGEREVYISAERYEFEEEEFADIADSVNNQTMILVNEDTILSEFDEPFEFNGNHDELLEQIHRGSEYEFWGEYDEHVILFFQEQNDRTVFFNTSGLIAVTLNEDGEAVNYAQRILGDTAVQSEEQTVLDPINAIEVLYSSVLQRQDEVTDMSLGYHTLIEEGPQIFTPTWKITINDESDYFVNAIEGQLIPNNEENFVQAISYFIDYQVQEFMRSENE